MQTVLAVSAAVIEEIAFRGFLFNRQLPDIGVLPAAVYNGVLFALFHFPQFLIGQHLGALVSFRFWLIVAMGGIFSLSFFRWKNLGMNIVIHSYWNLLSYIFATA